MQLHSHILSVITQISVCCDKDRTTVTVHLY